MSDLMVEDLKIEINNLILDLNILKTSGYYYIDNFSDLSKDDYQLFVVCATTQVQKFSEKLDSFLDKIDLIKS